VRMNYAEAMLRLDDRPLVAIDPSLVVHVDG
jgi:hypothetical protein